MDDEKENIVIKHLMTRYNPSRLVNIVNRKDNEIVPFDLELYQLIYGQPNNVKAEFKGIESKALPINITRSAKATSILCNNGLDSYSAYSLYLASNAPQMSTLLDAETVYIIRLATKALILQLRRIRDLCERSNIKYKNLFDVDYDKKRGIVKRDIDKIHGFISEQIKSGNKFYIPTENQGTPSGLWLPKNKFMYYTLSHFSTLESLEDRNYDEALKFLLVDKSKIKTK